MPFFRLIWVTSWVSCFLSSSQGLLKVPDSIASTLPARAFSVVNHPLELPNPLIFPTPFDFGVGFSNASIAAIPNRAFHGITDSFQFGTQQSQGNTRLVHRSDEPKNSLCHPDSEQKEESPIANTVPSSSVLWQETHPREASKTALPQQIWQVMQNLLVWRPRFEEAESSVLVVSTHSSEPIKNEGKTEKRLAKQGFWKYSQWLANRFAGTSAPNKSEQFQVWMKGRLIAQFPKRKSAELMAQRLKQFFYNSSNLALEKAPVEPAFSNGLPVVNVGDRVLYQVADDLAKDLDHNGELIAIEWANNLRMAIGQKPLELAEAQQQMHNLVETQQTFEGFASWYASYFHGRVTATGETYNQHKFTAAHPSLPFDTYVKVENLENGNDVIVRINDRGPYVPGRTLDLSQEAVRCLNAEKAGLVSFKAVIMQPSSH